MEKMCVSSAEFDGKGCNGGTEARNEKFCFEGNRSQNHLFDTGTIAKQTDFASSFEDIPSYQIIRDSKRFSEGSEEQESILPISPVITPPSVPNNRKEANLEMPFFHTIGTIVKKNTGSKDLLTENDAFLLSNDLTNERIKTYDGLTSIDKDISWESSMETPAPNIEHLGEYNTIEKATLLPEEDMKNMQPRALFSPHKIDDTEFLPLRYSSESEDEKCSYLAGKQGSNTCENAVRNDEVGLLKDSATANALIIYNQSSSANLTDDTYLENESMSPISPIFKVTKCKKKLKTKKRQQLLIKSPTISHGINVRTSNSDKINREEKKIIQTSDICDKMPSKGMEEKDKNFDASFNENCNSIQDDSFQNMSFSYIDELCRSSVTSVISDSSDNIDCSTMSKPNCFRNETKPKIATKNGVKNLSPIMENTVSGKCFYYDTCKNDELQPVFSLDDFLQTAEELEEESNILFDKKPCEAFMNNELKVFNELLSEIPKNELKIQEMKSKQSICSPKEPMGFLGNNLLKLNNEREECNNIFNNISELDADEVSSFSSSFKGTLDNQKIIENRDIHESINHPSVIQQKDNDKTCALFSTTSGRLVYGLYESCNKTQSMLRNNFKKTGENKVKSDEEEFQGFKTASGTAINISEKSLNKAKNLLRELDICDNNTESEDINKFLGFTTASGSKIEVSEKSLQTAKKVLNDVDFNILSRKSQDLSELAKVTGQEERSIGFKMASNKSVQILNKSLETVEAFWQEEEEIPMECIGGETQRLKDNDELLEIQNSNSEEKKGTRNNSVISNEISSSIKPQFFGFSTASGKNISVSEKALTKAKEMLKDNGEVMDCETLSEDVEKVVVTPVTETGIVPVDDSSRVDSSESSEFVPSWLHAYYTSPTLTISPVDMRTHDCRNNSEPKEAYVIKSPVLGITDRFFNKKKRKAGRKLDFHSPKEQILKKNTSDQNYIVSHKGDRPSNKRNLSDLDSDFSIKFKKRKVKHKSDIDFYGFGMLNEEVIQGRKKARLEQAKAGEKLQVNSIKGSHLLKKEGKQLNFFNAVRGAYPEKLDNETLRLKYGLRDDVLQLTVKNAPDYRFNATNFYTRSDCMSNVEGFPVGDGCLLVFDDNNTAGVEEFARAFFASSGVQPKLISEEWIKNHYKWIVWKLSRYERNFPYDFGGRCLTPHNVMLQLKYRYDREIDACQRSALKKVLERDESSTKRMVLLVFDIKKVSGLNNKTTELSSNKTVISYELGLTDGWYGCYAEIDSAMISLIEETKVTIGTKLITQGAELLNCNKGLTPLEISEKPCLKIYTNSTRRAKWNSKLGFQKNGGPLLVSLNSILPNGGVIGRVDAVIVRIYPLLYMEKKSNGTHVIRNSRMEDKAAAEFQQKQAENIEKIYQRVKDEVRNKEKKGKIGFKISLSDISKITDPEELYNLYESCSDPSSFQNVLSKEQKEFIIDYQRRRDDIRNKELSEKIQEKIKTDKINVRKVSQLLKLKIVDLHKPDYANPVLFTVWNSTEDVSRLFSEGKVFSFFSTLPGNSRFHNLVHLNSIRYTQYREINKKIEYPVRRLSQLKELTLDYEPVFNEIDVVGIVVYIHETSYGSRLSRTVFLSDLEYNFVGIVFWDHFKDFGWENVLIVNSIVSCSNLQWNRKRSSSGIPSVYVNDFSIFKENPKEIYFQEEIKRLKASLPIDMKKFITRCQDEINLKLDEQKNSNLSRIMSNPNDSSNSSIMTLKPKYVNGFKTKPTASSTPFKCCAFGLDASDQEPSPIQKRIEKLQMYGEPPPMTPLLPLNNLEKFNTKFKVPFKNVNSSSNKILP